MATILLCGLGAAAVEIKQHLEKQLPRWNMPAEIVLVPDSEPEPLMGWKEFVDIVDAEDVGLAKILFVLGEISREVCVPMRVACKNCKYYMELTPPRIPLTPDHLVPAP